MQHEKTVEFDIWTMVGLSFLLNALADYSGSQFVEEKQLEISGNKISISLGFEESLQEVYLQSC